MLDIEPARKTLESVADALEGLGITYWIDSGTLLSAYRDKNINIYDHDIDIRVFEDEVSREKLADVIRALWLADFNLMHDSHSIRAEVILVNRSQVMLDFKLCYRDSEHVWYCCWQRLAPLPVLHVYPRKFFNKLGLIELLGRRYPCPQPVEEYLIHNYGEEWKLFKVRVEEAEETDLTWDYMKDPPCSMTLIDFNKLKGKCTVTVERDAFNPIWGFMGFPPVGTKILYRCRKCFKKVIGEVRALSDADRKRLDTSAPQMCIVNAFPCEHREYLQPIQHLKGERCTTW